MILVALQLIDFNVFHLGGLVNFVLLSGACLSITERINLFRMSNWLSVSLNEYTVLNDNNLKSFMQVSKSKCFKFRMNL